MPSNARRLMQCFLLKPPILQKMKCMGKFYAHEDLQWRQLGSALAGVCLGLGPHFHPSVSFIISNCLRLLICSWEGPWAFLAAPLGHMGFQVDSPALHTPWGPVALSQLWMGEEGFHLCSVGHSGHLGQGLYAGVPERSWLLVAGLSSSLHCHPVLSCCLKYIWRTELRNEHPNEKFPQREILQPPVHSRVWWKVWGLPCQQPEIWGSIPSQSLHHIFPPVLSARPQWRKVEAFPK